MLNDSPSLSNSNSSMANLTSNPTNPQAPTAFSSSYPIPPMQYVNLYSDESIAKGKSLNPPKPITEGTKKALNFVPFILFKIINSNSFPLAHTGSFSMFGVSMTNDEAIIRPLESQGIKRLYAKDSDHKKELKKMNASILINFLDLLDVLVKCPDTSKREEKGNDIMMLFVQMHHLINELRPHQARETIRVTLQCQNRQRVEIIQKLNEQIERVNEMVINCVRSIPEINGKIGQEELDFLKEMKKTLEAQEYDLDSANQKPYSQINCLDSIMCKLVDEI